MSKNEYWKDNLGDSVTISLSKSAAALKTDPTKKEVEVKINASDSLKDIVNKINAAVGSGVKASLMVMANGENRLILTAVDTGTKSFYMKENGGTSFLSNVLGVIEDDKQQATTSDAFLTKTGAATEETTFAELYTGLGSSNKLADGDVMSIKIGSEVVSTTISSDKTIGEVLEELNDQLSSGLKASLNSSGEIIITNEGNSDFNANEIEVKILDGSNNDKVKKDFGKLSVGNVFAEDNIINNAVNAFYTVDGIAINSQSNNDSKSITGTTFSLKKADPDRVIKVSLEADMDGLADKIKGFIDEFNALLKFIDENTKASVVEEEDKFTGKKISKREVGVFSGDSNISTLRESLKKMLTGTIEEITGNLNNGYSTSYSAATRIGITTGKDGYMEVDKTKLVKALNADFEGVRRLFTSNSFSDTPGYSIGRFTKDSKAGVYEVRDDGVFLRGGNGENLLVSTTADILTLKSGLCIQVPPGGGDANVTFVRGIAGQISNFVEQAKNSVDGYFKKSKKTYQARIDSIEKRVSELQTRVDRYNIRLTNQFNALERSMSTLQMQSSNMMSALGGVSYKR
jgi:flagellar hook-associated protein 2